MSSSMFTKIENAVKSAAAKLSPSQNVIELKFYILSKTCVDVSSKSKISRVFLRLKNQLSSEILTDIELPEISSAYQWKNFTSDLAEFVNNIRIPNLFAVRLIMTDTLVNGNFTLVPSEIILFAQKPCSAFKKLVSFCEKSGIQVYLNWGDDFKNKRADFLAIDNFYTNIDGSRKFLYYNPLVCEGLLKWIKSQYQKSKDKFFRVYRDDEILYFSHCVYPRSFNPQWSEYFPFDIWKLMYPHLVGA